MNEQIRKLIEESIATKQRLLQDPVILDQLPVVVEKIVAAFKDGKRVYFCGNGGSAADAQHLAAELSGRFYADRPALPAEALHCNTSYLTAVANDYSYDIIYQRLVAGYGQAGDVLIGFSTSGNSKNVVLAFEEARKRKMLTVGLTGAKGGEMKNISDHWFGVPSNDTPRIQESHILLGHIICQLVEERYFQ
ncbi:MAG TPA: D-sedoheptulose 7-phosphate isomerase [Saprospiraceae bacterium]|nr:D-sedoheptulose 7-phosphate isomerase [Saprospiraceae bacterium]